MKFNKKLLVAVLAGTLVLGSGVSTYATADNTNHAKMLQEKVSVEVLNEILNNVCLLYTSDAADDSTEV